MRPAPSSSGPAVVDGWLAGENERVRYVLRARLSASGVSQTDIVDQLRIKGHLRREQRDNDGQISRSTLSRRLAKGDVIGNDLELVRELERVAIHNTETSRFAERIIDDSRMDRRGDPSWWVTRFSKQDAYDSALESIVAGLSLVRWTESVGIAHAVDQTRNSIAVEALVVSLCRVASGAMGHAHDAMTIIARLGPVVSRHVSKFIVVEPMGPWVTRAADGALRRYATQLGNEHVADMFDQYYVASAELHVDVATPSRSISHLRLFRRLALDSSGEAQRRSVERLRDVAADDENPSRWRRFALWVSAEPAIREPEKFRQDFDELCASLACDPVVEDVVGVLTGTAADCVSRRGPYNLWAGNAAKDFDLTVLDHRDSSGRFVWPLTRFPATDLLLQKFTGRGLVYSDESVLDIPSVGALALPELRTRTLDIVHELIVHPGFIRAQTYVDVLAAAGPQVMDVVVELVSGMVHSIPSPKHESEHLASCLDSMLFLLGRTRRLEALPSLIHAYHNWSSEELRSSALWSIGDILAGLGAELPSLPISSADVIEVLHSGLGSKSVSVVRAALHAVAVAGITSLGVAGVVEAHAAASPDVGEWAKWCKLVWSGQTHYLNAPPNALRVVSDF